MAARTSNTVDMLDRIIRGGNGQTGIIARMEAMEARLENIQDNISELSNRVASISNTVVQLRDVILSNRSSISSWETVRDKVIVPVITSVITVIALSVLSLAFVK